MPSPRAARSSPIAAPALAIALALAASAFLLAPSRTGTAASGSPTAWRGYRVLLVDARADERRVLAALKDAGAWPAISASTQPVLVSDWSRPVAMSLAEAERSLIPGDPRLDPYIARLGSWFEARIGDDEYRVIYLPEKRSRDLAAISEALEGLGIEFALPEAGGASFLESHPLTSFILSAAIMATAIAAGSFIGRRIGPTEGVLRIRPSARAFESAILRLALAAPFAAIAWKGSWASLVATLWTLALMDLADTLEAYVREAALGGGFKRAFGSAISSSPPGLFILASAIGALAFRPVLIPAIAAALGSSAAAAAFLSTIPSSSRRRFAPIAIGKRRYASSSSSKLRASLACLAVLLAVLDSILGGGISPTTVAASDVTYPLPISTAGSAKPLPAEAAKRMKEEGAEGRLPGLASWLAHAARQESIPFARIGEERDDPFASLAFPSIEEEPVRVVFDDEWARIAYQGISEASIEGMLAVQGGAKQGFNEAVLEPRTPSGATISPKASPLAPMSALLYILLLIPPLLRIAAGKLKIRASSTSGVRQEA